MAWVLERATGQSLADLVSRHLWQPIDAARDAYFTVDEAGTAWQTAASTQRCAITLASDC
ncbi:hypothetical protein [Mesorhizobium sp. 10J20-29]